MPTDLEQQLARFAEALDREAPAISLDDVVGRGTVAVDLLAPRIDGGPWIDTTPGHGEIDDHDGLIELAPVLVVRRPAWRPAALKVALAVAAVAALVVTLAAIERGGDELGPADDFPRLTMSFVSPRSGFSVKYPDGAAVAPAQQPLEFNEQGDDEFDVIETGLAAVFKGTSVELSYRPPGVSIEEWADENILPPDACRVPRSQQADITIDGEPGRLSECPSQIEATVVAGGRLYLFTLSHDRRDARGIFGAFVATIELTPETAVRFPAMTTTFVSPTYGYSFKYHDRGGLAPATELWDPGHQPVSHRNLDDRFDAVETGLLAYFEAASTPIPDGVPIDAWVDEYVTARAASGCGVPRSQQAEITIDGQPGRIAKCGHSEATVVAGGRLYLFRGPDDDREWFDAWIATIDLTPETAAAT